MHGATFLHDLAIVMITAGVVTVLFHRLKLPVVLGYILAGVLVGPHVPIFPFVQDRGTIQTLSELGVILLMFSLGLEFSLRKLKEVGAAALIAATLKILIVVFAGYVLGVCFGWKKMDSVFLGAILSISSTTIIVKALEELGKTREKFAELIYGILIVEDILAIVMIAVLSGFATTGSLHASDLAMTVVRLTAFLGAVLVAGLLAVPRLLNYVGKFKSNEMLLISTLGLCFGVSLLAEKLGYSVALGAFLIGAVVAEARQIARIELLMQPVRDMFIAIFFVSIGLLIDPAMLAEYLVPVLVISAVVVAGKVLACAFGAFIAGSSRRESLQVGMGLVPIGEFSFIIASLGMTTKVTGAFLYPIAVAVSAITTLLTPFLIGRTDWVVARMDALAPAALANYLDLYTRWIGQLRQNRSNNFAFKLARLWAIQMAVCLVLVTAIFIAAAFFRHRALAWWPSIPEGENGVKSLLWLGAMVLSLPLLIAVFRKLQALGMLLAEVSVTREAAGARTETLRAIVSGTILIAGCIGLLQLVLLLSSTILPAWNALAVLALLLVLATILLWRFFIRIYASAQFTLRETFTQPPPARHQPVGHELLPLLRDAGLASVRLQPGMFAAGKMISELGLREKTGANIVGIERAGASMVNPAPHEELRAGDLVLLLGGSRQLSEATALLEGGDS
jgi:CPA2 family monovalent cation:H+ antiporter-2